MRIASPERRLDGLWGLVDQRHNAELMARLGAGPVLDLGCGYGTLTRELRGAGIAAVGVESDAAALEIARRGCSECRFELAEARSLPLPDAGFGTIVLRDSLHHFVSDRSWPQIAAEIIRVLAPGGRVVVLDPNVTPIVRLARIAVRHRDEVCTVASARDTLAALGLRVSAPSFNTLFTLPLSGGYVGPELVPRLPRLHTLLMRLEAVGERLLARAGLLRFVAWRYVLVGER